MALQTISTDDLARVVRAYRDALAEHRPALNRLNVYPVPDGDTGTNMGLTLDAVVRELDGPGASAGDIAALARCLSHGSLMGARGNSGVILSQILRGMSSAFTDAAGHAAHGATAASVDASQLAEALARASASAYAAVSNPVEGTILTVARAAAEGAEAALADGEAGAGGSLVRVLDAARASAARALAGTPEQLPVLKAAGVVDAGGAGLLLLLDSFLLVVEGRPVPPPPAPSGAAPAVPGLRPAAAQVPVPEGVPAGVHGPGDDVGDLRYEVMFFLEAPDEAVPGFREVWDGCGGSVVIVGGDGLYNCHIHTDDIGAAIEAAIEIGRPRQIRVTDLTEQVEEERWVREAAASAPAGEPASGRVTCAVVAVCAGEGVKRIFRSLGARQVVAGGQSANPSTAEVLAAIEASPAEQVVVLPNNPNVVAVAEQAAAHTRKKVRVVPTPGIPEGFAALLAYDPEADVDTNADSMAAAAEHVVAGEVAQASRDAVTDAGPAREGDWLGIGREGIRFVAPAPGGPADAAVGLLDQLVPPAAEHEIVTIIEGEGAHAAETRRIVEWLSENRPGVSSEVHHGGQPLYPYLFSIE
jgi:hypothetical protein